MNGGASTLGWLSFLSFAFSVFAAVLAIDMYKLLRTGEFGKTWRLLIIASVMFVLLQVLRMAEVVNVRMMRQQHLSEVVELCFVIVLTYAFYQQRKVFTHEHKTHQAEELESAEAEYSLDAGGDLDDEEPDDELAKADPPSQWPDVSRTQVRPRAR
jgi:hypothetical protein